MTNHCAMLRNPKVFDKNEGSNEVIVYMISPLIM